MGQVRKNKIQKSNSLNLVIIIIIIIIFLYYYLFFFSPLFVLISSFLICTVHCLIKYLNYFSLKKSFLRQTILDKEIKLFSQESKVSHTACCAKCGIESLRKKKRGERRNSRWKFSVTEPPFKHGLERTRNPE